MTGRRYRITEHSPTTRLIKAVWDASGYATAEIWTGANAVFRRWRLKVCNAVIVSGVVLAISGASAVVAADPKQECVSDQPYLVVASQQHWGVLGYNVAAHMPGTTPRPLQVKETQYQKGLGTHATSEIIVALDGRYVRFEAQVGVQFQAGSPARNPPRRQSRVGVSTSRMTAAWT